MSQFNQRLSEQSIFADSDIGSTSGGDSSVIDLNGASKFSCQANFDVSAPGAKDFNSGDSAISTFTFAAQADTNSGDYMVVYDTEGLAWAVAADLTGTDPAPTGAVWTAIPAERKALADLSAATTAATVAIRFNTAITGLGALTFSNNRTSNHITCSQSNLAEVTPPAVYNADDSGAGSITVVEDAPGVDSDVNVADSEITITSHGYPTGFKVQLTTTGGVPDPLFTATDYFIIVVDANTIQFAATLEDALAGTFIVLVDQGTQGSVNTVTGEALAASVTFKKSNNGTDWVNIQAATTISADGSVVLEQPNVSYRYFKATKTLTGGVVDLTATTIVIGDA